MVIVEFEPDSLVARQSEHWEMPLRQGGSPQEAHLTMDLRKKIVSMCKLVRAGGEEQSMCRWKYGTVASQPERPPLAALSKVTLSRYPTLVHGAQ